MKKIINILIASVCVLGIVSCSDDTENPYERNSQLKVVSSSVIFDAPASTGSVVVSSEAPVTARLNSSWATATVDGSVVNVSVKENDDLDGRSAILTIFSGTDSVNVTVQQSGLVFQLSASSPVVAGDDASVQKFGMRHNTDVKLTSSAEWIAIDQSSDSLKLNLAANNEGHLRKGYVYYSSGTTTDSIEVIQADFDKDIAGDYFLMYYSSESTTQMSYMMATVYRDSVVLPQLGLSIPSKFDESDLSLNFQCGQYLGTYDIAPGTTYYIYNPFILGGGYWTSYYTTTYAWGYFDHSGKEAATFVSIDQTTNSNGFIGFYLEAFAEHSFVSSGDSGALLEIYNPLLEKFDPESAAKPNLKGAKKARLKYVLK